MQEHHDIVEPPVDDNALMVRRVQVEVGHHIHQLQIVAQADGFILRGRATSYYAKQLAQHVVMRLSSRRVLTNEIEVD